jgi:glycosyltransferase involved in cell wall biosynthesis
MDSPPAEPGRGVLHVIHDHGCGTETHVRALIAGSREHWRHYLAIAVGDRWQVEEHRTDGGVVTFDLERGPQEPWDAFVGGICVSFGIALIHLHNISACREGILRALEVLPVPYGYTVHDLNFACPTITFLAADGMYCGAETDASVCSRCLAAQPAFDRIDIREWRARHHALLRRAAFRIAPSQWAADTVHRYFPDCPATVIAHGSPDGLAPRLPGVRTTVMLPDDDVPSVAVLGAIGPDKGARRLERLAQLARARGAAVRFVLIGYLTPSVVPGSRRCGIHGSRAVPALRPARLARGHRGPAVVSVGCNPEILLLDVDRGWAAAGRCWCRRSEPSPNVCATAAPGGS